MQCNPVTYALVILRKAFYLVPTQLIADGAFVHALLITGGWTVLTTVGAAGWWPAIAAPDFRAGRASNRRLRR